MCAFGILEEDPPLSARFTLAKGPDANPELIGKIQDVCRSHRETQF